MTAIPSVSPPATSATGTSRVLGRAIAAEWTRLSTVRSTWWSLLAAAAMMLFLGVAFGMDMDEPTPIWVAGELAIVFAQFALAIPAMLAVTSEYSTRAIRSSLQAVPRRGVLASSRALVAVGAATIAGTGLTLTADVASWIALRSNAQVVPGELIGSLGAVAILVASGAILTVGIGMLLRSSAGTLTSVFLLLLVLPVLLPSFGIGWLAAAGRHLPGNAAISLLDAFGEPTLSTPRAAIVLITWIVVAVAAGGWSLLRRNAA